MVDSDTPARDRRVELVATIVLAVAAVSTAWSTYQSTQWRGTQAVDTSKSTAARIESSEAATRAGQQVQIDIATFTEWVNANVDGNTRLADFYRKRFRPEFRPAFNAWLAAQPAATGTPFDLPQYRLAESTHAKQLDAVATSRSNAAQTANKRADAYMLAVVLFASALFFAGVSSKIRSLRQREVIIAIGALILLGTVVWVATLPASLTY